jgi:dienelactone hydrolase
MLARPTIATIRAVDIVHLVGTGMCFGAAIVALAWARSQQ